MSKVQWFARGGGLVRSGPFKTYAEASKSLVLKSSQEGYPEFPVDAFVWAEEVESKSDSKK